MTSPEHFPKHHHLDRRADRLITEGADAHPDDLLNTKDLATWLGCSTSWLEIGRSRGYGPPFIVLGRRCRYKRSAVLSWLQERTHRCTIEYPHHASPGRPKQRKAD